MLARCGGAADEEGNFEAEPFHFRCHAHHLVEGWGDETARADEVDLLFFGGFEDPFRRDRKGIWSEAIDELQRGRSLDDNPALIAKTGEVYAASGRRDEALKTLQELNKMSEVRYVDGYHFAAVYTALGENEIAFDWLEKAFEERSNGLIFLKVDPVFDPLRDDPRFQDLPRRMNLPE
jgi:tetratricopeptide (TPR) repeat protein